MERMKLGRIPRLVEWAAKEEGKTEPHRKVVKRNPHGFYKTLRTWSFCSVWFSFVSSLQSSSSVSPFFLSFFHSLVSILGTPFGYPPEKPMFSVLRGNCRDMDLVFHGAPNKTSLARQWWNCRACRRWWSLFQMKGAGRLYDRFQTRQGTPHGLSGYLPR